MKTNHRICRTGVVGLILAFAGVLAFGLSACNTTEGFGKDVKAAGSGIEKAADEHK